MRRNTTPALEADGWDPELGHELFQCQVLTSVGLDANAVNYSNWRHHKISLGLSGGSTLSVP
jgi:hypothetical protein